MLFLKATCKQKESEKFKVKDKKDTQLYLFKKAKAQKKVYMTYNRKRYTN